ncbi:hypothetical protein ACSBR1_003790 [Camellia fascicularis]
MANEGLEFSHKNVELNDEMAEMLFLKRRFCFCIPFFGNSNRSAVSGRRSLPGHGERPSYEGSIRARVVKEKQGKGKFQYDPLSYALNFDDGQV